MDVAQVGVGEPVRVAQPHHGRHVPRVECRLDPVVGEHGSPLQVAGGDLEHGQVAEPVRPLELDAGADRHLLQPLQDPPRRRQLAVPHALPPPLDVRPPSQAQAGTGQRIGPIHEFRARRPGEHGGRRQRRRTDHLQLLVVMAQGDVQRLFLQAHRLTRQTPVHQGVIGEQVEDPAAHELVGLGHVVDLGEHLVGLGEVEPDAKRERRHALAPGWQVAEDGVDHGDRPGRLPCCGAVEDLRDGATHQRRHVVEEREPDAVGGEVGGQRRRSTLTGALGGGLELRRRSRVALRARQGEVAGALIGIGDELVQAGMEGAAGGRIHVRQGDRPEQRVGATHHHRRVEREQVAFDGVGERPRCVGQPSHAGEQLGSGGAEGGNGLEQLVRRRRGACQARRHGVAQRSPRGGRHAIARRGAGQLECVHRVPRRHLADPGQLRAAGPSSAPA